jgi:hypothetical protein
MHNSEALDQHILIWLIISSYSAVQGEWLLVGIRRYRLRDTSARRISWLGSNIIKSASQLGPVWAILTSWHSGTLFSGTRSTRANMTYLIERFYSVHDLPSINEQQSQKLYKLQVQRQSNYTFQSQLLSKLTELNFLFNMFHIPFSRLDYNFSTSYFRHMPQSGESPHICDR